MDGLNEQDSDLANEKADISCEESHATPRCQEQAELDQLFESDSDEIADQQLPSLHAKTFKRGRPMTKSSKEAVKQTLQRIALDMKHDDFVIVPKVKTLDDFLKNQQQAQMETKRIEETTLTKGDPEAKRQQLLAKIQDKDYLRTLMMNERLLSLGGGGKSVSAEVAKKASGEGNHALNSPVRWSDIEKGIVERTRAFRERSFAELQKIHDSAKLAYLKIRHFEENEEIMYDEHSDDQDASDEYNSNERGSDNDSLDEGASFEIAKVKNFTEGQLVDSEDSHGSDACIQFFKSNHRRTIADEKRASPKQQSQQQSQQREEEDEESDAWISSQPKHRVVDGHAYFEVQKMDSQGDEDSRLSTFSDQSDASDLELHTESIEEQNTLDATSIGRIQLDNMDSFDMEQFFTQPNPPKPFAPKASFCDPVAAAVYMTTDAAKPKAEAKTETGTGVNPVPEEATSPPVLLKDRAAGEMPAQMKPLEPVKKKPLTFLSKYMDVEAELSDLEEGGEGYARSDDDDDEGVRSDDAAMEADLRKHFLGDEDDHGNLIDAHIEAWKDLKVYNELHEIEDQKALNRLKNKYIYGIDDSLSSKRNRGYGELHDTYFDESGAFSDEDDKLGYGQYDNITYADLARKQLRNWREQQNKQFRNLMLFDPKASPKGMFINDYSDLEENDDDLDQRLKIQPGHPESSSASINAILKKCAKIAPSVPESSTPPRLKKFKITQMQPDQKPPSSSQRELSKNPRLSTESSLFMTPYAFEDSQLMHQDEDSRSIFTLTANDSDPLKSDSQSQQASSSQRWTSFRQNIPK